MTMTRDPYKYFRIEAKELLEQLGQAATELEKGALASAVVPGLLRAAHTLKGAARVVKQREIADAAHALEDALSPHREAAAPAPEGSVQRAVELVAQMAKQLALLSAPEPTAAPVRAEAPVRTIRTDVAEVNELLDVLTEARSELVGLRRALDGVQQAEQLASVLVDRLAAARALAGNAALGSVAEELATTLARAGRTLVRGVDGAERELGQVREVAERLRLIPASTLFGPLERAARDVARAQGKTIVFEHAGGGVRLDAHVLAVVQDALVQLVRNAVAHGIESESERISRRKPASGRVAVLVRRIGRRVAFACRDDGRGIDVEALQRAAERHGRSSRDLVDLLLSAGVSTSTTVTELSGRGIGLDVVREAKSQLNGDVSAQTERGIGTTIELVVPVSLAAFEAVVVESGGLEATIPLDSVLSALRVEPGRIARSPEGDSVLFEDAPVPFYALERLLGGARQPTEAAARTAVVVRGASGRVAIAVERLRGVSQVVLRELPPLAVADATVAGVSLDAEGNPRLVLDPDGLSAMGRRIGGTPHTQPADRPPILVIDDSLTTRMLEQSILESAGYEVELATSAEDALEKARLKRYALFLVDVEMPGMNGFEFIARVRADPVLSATPSILVTSRASVDDKRRGHEVGASDYVVKSEFDQGKLLQRIEELVT